MATGPGKYDDEATIVRERTCADTVVVLILAGDKGNGFAVQSVDPQANLMLPKLLREMAEEIERSMS